MGSHSIRRSDPQVGLNNPSSLSRRRRPIVEVPLSPLSLSPRFGQPFTHLFLALDAPRWVTNC